MRQIKIVLSCLLIIFSGCSFDNKLDEVVNKWYGKKILLQPSICNNNSNNNMKIVTRINGNCYSCINELRAWEPIVQEINNKWEIPFYIYVVIADSMIYHELNKREIHFNYPVIFDYNDEFKKLNNLDKNKIFHTMLLDEDDRVLIIGSPISNQKLRNIYFKRINTRKKNNYENNE